MGMTRVILHIDKLVLKGLQRDDAASITDGLAHALKTRLAEPNASAALVSRNAHARGVDKITLSHHGDAGEIGKVLADHVTGRGRQ